jgi:hypothetical protein
VKISFFMPGNLLIRSWSRGAWSSFERTSVSLSFLREVRVVRSGPQFIPLRDFIGESLHALGSSPLGYFKDQLHWEGMSSRRNAIVFGSQVSDAARNIELLS